MSTTNNLGLFKHDNPATKTDQFNVDKSLNQNWDKVDKEAGNVRTRLTTLETDNTTNKQDIANIKAEQEVQNNNIELNKTNMQQYVSELEAENSRLREDLNGLPSGQVSGENIDISDSSDMRFSEFKISENSKQETRSGKNLLNDSLFPNSYSKNGITFTNNNNGTFNVSGTATANTTVGLITSIDNIQQNKNYYFYCTEKYDATNFNLSVQITYEDSTIQYILPNNSTVTSSKDKGITKSAISLYIPNGITVNFKNVRVMLVQNNNIDNEYEQYGASPSLDYPSEVRSCGDNGSINVVICNKNMLIDTKETGNYVSNGINYVKKDDGSIMVSGTATENSSYSFEKNFTNYPAGTYNISGCPENGSGSTYRIVVWDKDWKIKAVDIGNSARFNVVEGEKIRTQILIEKGQTVKNLMFYAQLELNEKTNYKKHQEQNYTIDVQEPMLEEDYFDLENGKEVHNWQILELNGNEKINLITNQRFQINLINANLPRAVNAYTRINAKSNYFNGKPLSESKVDNMIAVNDDSLYIRVSESTTLEELITFLKSCYESNKAVKVYYKLAEPRKLDLTDTQIKQLQTLDNEAKTYKNITHIYSTDEISPIINATYKKDLETLIAGSGV